MILADWWAKKITSALNESNNPLIENATISESKRGSNKNPHEPCSFGYATFFIL